jgi:hypothetical protein
MSDDEPDDGPPDSVTYDLDEALTLLAALEDTRDTLHDGAFFAGEVVIDAQIRLLTLRLGFGNDMGEGDDD